MNKRFKIFMILALTMCIGINVVKAASGPVYVYYETGFMELDRYPTYTYTKQHMEEIGYTVEARKDWDSSGLLYALQDAKIVVYNGHGSPGRQETAYKNSTIYAIVGTGSHSDNFKNVSSLSNGSISQLKMAIMYGCKTGISELPYGNLPQTMVDKGAQAAVAWKIDTHIPTTIEWNRLFFEKAKTDSIVESFRHADYWLRNTKGDIYANDMQYNRSEAGNIYGYIN